MTLTHWKRSTLLRQLIVGALVVGLTMGGTVFAQPMQQMPNAQGPEGQRPEDQKPDAQKAQKKEVQKPGVQKAAAPKSGGPYPAVGKISPNMPGSYDVVRSGPDEFYFHEGVFYARDPQGFKVVSPPRGIVIGRLPVGFETLIVAGVTYFLYAGVYYNQAAAGYVVVDAPSAQTVVVQEAAATGKLLTVDVELLNVRSGPGVNHSVVSRVHLGDKLTVEGTADEWYYVQLSDGSYGWVMSKYTKPVMPEAKG